MSPPIQAQLLLVLGLLLASPAVPADVLLKQVSALSFPRLLPACRPGWGCVGRGEFMGAATLVSRIPSPWQSLPESLTVGDRVGPFLSLSFS